MISKLIILKTLGIFKNYLLIPAFAILSGSAFKMARGNKKYSTSALSVLETFPGNFHGICDAVAADNSTIAGKDYTNNVYCIHFDQTGAFVIAINENH